MTQSYVVPLGEAEDGAWGPVTSGTDIYDPPRGGRHTPLVSCRRDWELWHGGTFHRMAGSGGGALLEGQPCRHQLSCAERLVSFWGWQE